MLSGYAATEIATKKARTELGHSSAKTLDVYAKAITTLQKESANHMGAIFGGLGFSKGPNNGRKKSRTLISQAAGRSEAWLSRLSGGQEIAGSNPVGPISKACCSRALQT